MKVSPGHYGKMAELFSEDAFHLENYRSAPGSEIFNEKQLDRIGMLLRAREANPEVTPRVLSEVCSIADEIERRAEGGSQVDSDLVTRHFEAVTKMFHKLATPERNPLAIEEVFLASCRLVRAMWGSANVKTFEAITDQLNDFHAADRAYEVEKLRKALRVPVPEGECLDVVLVIKDLRNQKPKVDTNSVEYYAHFSEMGPIRAAGPIPRKPGEARYPKEERVANCGRSKRNKKTDKTAGD